MPKSIEMEPPLSIMTLMSPTFGIGANESFNIVVDIKDVDLVSIPS